MRNSYLPNPFDNPRGDFPEIEVVSFDKVYGRVGDLGSYVWFYDPTRDYGVMREMGGIEEPIQYAPSSGYYDEDPSDATHRFVDYDHHALWDTFRNLDIYKDFEGDEGIVDDLYKGWRGYWVPDEGMLAFYKGGSSPTGGGDEIPTDSVIEGVLNALSSQYAGEEMGEGIDEDRIDVIRVIN
jgi:hypothetical protein